MKKGVVVLICLIFVLVLTTGNVFAFSFEDFFNKITGKVTDGFDEVIIESFKFEKTTNLLNVGESVQDLSLGFIRSGNLPNFLKDSKVEVIKGQVEDLGSYKYEQKIIPGDLVLQEFSDSDVNNGDSTTGFKMLPPNLILNYSIEFTKNIPFNLLPENEIFFLGKSYSIVEANSDLNKIVLKDSEENIFILESGMQILFNGKFIQGVKTTLFKSDLDELDEIVVSWTADERLFVAEGLDLKLPVFESLKLRFEGLSQNEDEVYGNLYLDYYEQKETESKDIETSDETDFSKGDLSSFSWGKVKDFKDGNFENIEVNVNVGGISESFKFLADKDNDGATEDIDCDDNDDKRSPNFPEICDGIDNDCDGEIDKGNICSADEFCSGASGCAKRTCSDSDGGFTPFRFAGTVKSSGGTFTDHCVNKNLLNEAVCGENNRGAYISKDCDCLGGKCVELIAKTCRRLKNMDSHRYIQGDYDGCEPSRCPAGSKYNNCNEKVTKSRWGGIKRYSYYETCFDEYTTGCRGVPQCIDGYAVVRQEKCDTCGDSAGCIGSSGDFCDGFVKLSVESLPEKCDGRDNNCNGQIDEGISVSCGVSDIGECKLGAKACVGSGTYGGCVGAVYPSNEVCDGKDNDCDGKVDEGLICGVLKEENECVEAIKRGDPKDKADIVFVGDGYSDLNEFKKDLEIMLDFAGDNEKYGKKYPGLFSLEPFKTNKNMFNIWIVLAGENIPTDTPEENELTPNREVSLSYTSKCPHAEYRIIVSKSEFRSYARDETAYVSVGSLVDVRDGRVLAHEFGHVFGKLADEYLEPGKGNKPHFPNCAPDKETAERWWGDIISNEFYYIYDEASYSRPDLKKCNCDINLDDNECENKRATEIEKIKCYDERLINDKFLFYTYSVENKGIDIFEGCSYIKGNYKPTENSIMRDHTLPDDFGLVNERELWNVIDKHYKIEDFVNEGSKESVDKAVKRVQNNVEAVAEAAVELINPANWF